VGAGACAGGEEDLSGTGAGGGGSPGDAGSDVIGIGDSSWGAGGAGSSAGESGSGSGASGSGASGSGGSSAGGSPGDGGIVAEYLHPGRTFDEESAYVKWSGYVEFVPLLHKDATTLPPSEGGASCAAGCTEQVTKISDGAAVWGRFKGITSINVQLATSAEAGVGTASFEACAQTVGSYPLKSASVSPAAFSDSPATAWKVPTAGECDWKVSAKGGFVYFRAVTVTP